MILTFDPGRYVSEVILVGCGGTGAQLARAIARISRMMQDAGKTVPHLRFIDPDVIEQKNIGRQLFTDAVIGQNKAVALARRFNMALGLDCQYLLRKLQLRQFLSLSMQTSISTAITRALSVVQWTTGKRDRRLPAQKIVSGLTQEMIAIQRRRSSERHQMQNG